MLNETSTNYPNVRFKSIFDLATFCSPDVFKMMFPDACFIMVTEANRKTSFAAADIIRNNFIGKKLLIGDARETHFLLVHYVVY